MTNVRLNYEESCRQLQPDYLEVGDVPPMPDHVPRYDDPEPLGVNFFRLLVSEDDLSNLTLPRTFFGRSEVNRVSFENSDLSESCLCWNDFIDVNFNGTTLIRADLRASLYEQVTFIHSDLSCADLRRSTFTKCRFDGALMKGSILTRQQSVDMVLSAEQEADIAWTIDEGLEPDGG